MYVFNNRNALKPDYEIDFSRGLTGTSALKPVQGAGTLGAGTATLNRNTNEYNYDGSNVVALSDDDVRIHSTKGAGFEPAVAGIFVDGAGGGSRDFNGAPWTNTSGGAEFTITQNETGFDGTANKAWTLNKVSGSADEYVFSNNPQRNIASGETVAVTVFIKKDSDTTRFPEFTLYFTGGTDKYVTVGLNTSTGAVEFGSSTAGSPAANTEDWGDWWRLVIIGTDNGGNSTYGLYIRPAWGTTIGVYNANATGSIVIDGCQEYIGSPFAPSRHINTDGVSIGSEIIAAQADRDFSAASGWTNTDINAYDETDDLTITANTIGQYCTLPKANAPTVANKVYRVTLDVANIVSSWTLSDEDSNDTIATIDANGTTLAFYWICSTTGGGLRLTSLANDSSGDFDNFSIKEHGSVGVSESAQLQYTSPAIFGSDFTLITEVQWGFAEADVSTDNGIVACQDAVSSLLYHDVSGNGVASHDGTTEATDGLVFTADTAYKLIVRAPSSTGKFQVSTDTGSGISNGTEANYDNAFTDGGNLIFAKSLQGPIWIKYIKLYDRILSDNEIDALGSP